MGNINSKFMVVVGRFNILFNNMLVVVLNMVKFVKVVIR